MKIFKQGALTRWILILVLILFIISLLYLPLGLSFLIVPEQIFILSFIVFFILYSNVIAGFTFLNTLLSKIDDEEQDLLSFLQETLSLDEYAKYVVEGEILVLAENILLKLKERTSILFNIVMIFMFGFFILLLVGLIPLSIFYSIVLPALIVTIFVWGIEMFVSLKFVRVFFEKAEEFKKLLWALYKEQELEEKLQETVGQENKEDTEKENIADNENSQTSSENKNLPQKEV